MSAVLAPPRYHIERIDGREVEKPLPKRWHGLVQAYLIYAFLQQALVEIEVLPELDVLVGEGDWLVPDLVLAPAKARYENGMLMDAPALAVEILSPGQTFSEMAQKCERLHRAGTPVCWLIWPEKRRAWRYEAGDAPEAVDTLQFGEFRLPLEMLWKHLPVEQNA